MGKRGLCLVRLSCLLFTFCGPSFPFRLCSLPVLWISPVGMATTELVAVALERTVAWLKAQAAFHMRMYTCTHKHTLWLMLVFPFQWSWVLKKKEKEIRCFKGVFRFGPCGSCKSGGNCAKGRDGRRRGRRRRCSCSIRSTRRRRRPQ